MTSPESPAVTDSAPVYTLWQLIGGEVAPESVTGRALRIRDVEETRLHLNYYVEIDKRYYSVP